jgi:hypothetical protein
MSLERADVLAFMNRDWAGARRHKDASMGRWVESHGVAAAFRLSDMLLAQVWRPALAQKAKQGLSGLIAMRKKFARAEAKRR